MKTSRTMGACLATAILSVVATLGIVHLREPTYEQLLAEWHTEQAELGRLALAEKRQNEAMNAKLGADLDREYGNQ